MNKPLVSIVIPTCNRVELLKKCLDSIFVSNYDNYEVIVIDDNSKDDTESVLLSYGKKIQYIRNTKSEYLIRSRNIGGKISKGKYILFIDDDNIIDSKMISELVSFLELDDNVAVAGPIMYFESKRDTVWWSETLISFSSARTYFPNRNSNSSVIKENIKNTDGIPNVFIIRKSVFIELGCFDESYIDSWTEGDFTQLCKKNGYKVVRIKKAITYHCVSFGDWDGLTKRSIGDSPIKAYTTIRNRYKFVGKYFLLKDKVMFLLFYSWLIFFYYIYSTIKHGMYKNVRIYLKAVYDGIPMVFKK